MWAGAYSRGGRLAMVAGLALAAALVACRSEPADPGEPGERVVVVMESPPRQLDPRLVADASSTKVSKLIFCALTSLETDDLTPALDAASSVEPACGAGPEGCLHWVVRLRPEAAWQDGVRVGPEDVVFTYRSILESDLPSPFRADLEQKIRKVWSSGDAVHFELKVPVGNLAASLTIGLVPRHLLEPRGGLGATFRDDHLGCGPFRFLYRYGDRKVALERNELYWQPVGPRYVVVRFIPDEATRVLSLMAGSSQVGVNVLSPPLVDTLRESPDVTVLHRPAACTTYLSFNLRDPKLADVRVRRAVSLAIDRTGIVERQFRGLAVPARSLLPPMHWAFDPALPPLAYDPAEAARLLDEAGLAADPETGVRLELTLKVTIDRFRRSIGAQLAWKLGQVGISVRLLPLEFSTFMADIRRGNYQMFVLQVPEVTDPDILRWLLHSASTTLGNRSGYANPEFDRLAEQAFSVAGRKARGRLYGQAQRILARDLPLLPLWHEDNVGVVRNEVQGYRLLPINRYSPLVGVEGGAR